MDIKIVKLFHSAKTPTRESIGAAGHDLCACLNKQVAIMSRETVKVPTGIVAAIPNGYAGFIYARSGLATKHNVTPANCVGVIDSDYRGEIIVALHNNGDDFFVVNNGDRIAQLIIAPIVQAEFIESEKLNETERGCNGFGSTGIK